MRIESEAVAAGAVAGFLEYGGYRAAIIAHAKLDTTPEELDALAEREGLTGLY